MPVPPHNIVTQLGEKLVSMDRRVKIFFMLAADGIALPACFLVAMALRLGDLGSVANYGVTPHIVVGLITIAVFALSGLYHAVIRFIDQNLLKDVGVGLGLAILAAYAMSFIFNDQRLPRSALMIYWFIAFAYVVASRLGLRTLLRKDTYLSRSHRNLVAIYGAGVAGARLAQAMRVSDKYRALCFFDDKPSLSNSSVAGLRVFHPSQLAKTAEQFGIDLVVLAIPSAPPERRRQIMHVVHEAGIKIKTLRNLLELADEGISTQSIREIKIEDLLGRPPVPPKADLFAKCVQGQNVLVTGAGGSIGSELCRQIAQVNPAHLHLLDHSEYALYAVNEELRSRFPTMSIHAHLGSVCDAQLVERVLREGRIDTVYHAAAYKHVPLVEANMAEGIRNNVVGAQVVAAAAGKCGVRTCVLISTDKAVRPTNIMGASKRIAELIFQAAATRAGTDTTFCMVRFGNVLGSSGSVVPLFQRQIEQGGPITVTHPDVVRYFMLIPEAAQLVIQAGAMAKGGEVFVLDMGDPVKIVDLARTMIDMTGLKEKTSHYEDGDIEICYVGLRPGEKLYEELLIGNDVVGSEHPRIMYTKEYLLPADTLDHLIQNLLHACAGNSEDEIKAAMKKIVREYVPEQSGKQITARNRSASSSAQVVQIAAQR